MKIACGHLVVTRKKDEAILIGDAITVRVVRIANGDVRLRISAPRDVRVLREEIVSDGEGKKVA